VVVAVALVLTNRPPAEANGPKGPRAPAALTEQEVRAYIEIAPDIQRKLGDVAAQYEIARRQGQVDAEALGMQAAAHVDALLERRHLTRESWERLSKRVEYAVNAVRAAEELERERPGMEERLHLKKELLKRLAREDERKRVEQEIRELEALLEGGGPLLLDQDRELIRQYWKAVNAAAPQVGPQPRPPPPEPVQQQPLGK
jgi:hypothetical protein